MVLKKRKRTPGLGAGAAKAKRKRGAASGAAAPEADGADANVASEDELSSDGERPAPKSDGEEDDAFFETPDEKRVRLAKEYLGRIGGTERPKEEVQEQLQRDAEDQARRARIQVEDVVLGAPRLLRKAHRRAVTSVCLSADDATAFTGSKDCNVARWDVETGKHDVYRGHKNRPDGGGHFQKVLAVCLVEARQLLASGGVDRVVRLWDPRAPSGAVSKEGLMGHQGAVTAIAAEEDGSQLYTTSMDKSLKLWDLRTRRCTETLFGHVAGVTCMDFYTKHRPVTGGADKTVRLWKADKETHLLFNRHTYSADAVAAVDHERYLSGGQDGNLFLWSPASKKPLASASIGGSPWITALAAVRRGDVAFSGGVDGLLRCWRFGRGIAGAAEGDNSLRLAEALPSVPVNGCINAIAVGRKVLACGIGKEHRLGRWYYEQKRKNGLLIIPLSYREK